MSQQPDAAATEVYFLLIQCTIDGFLKKDLAYLNGFMCLGSSIFLLILALVNIDDDLEDEDDQCSVVEDSDMKDCSVQDAVTPGEAVTCCDNEMKEETSAALQMS